ncbi:hypothetical protein L9W86_17875, partial [Vibrio aestuarianus]|nr:hypothetical protein [Vibrio aestuarianus]
MSLSTGYISGVFGSLINNADKKVADFITEHTGITDDGDFTQDPDGRAGSHFVNRCDLITSNP